MTEHEPIDLLGALARSIEATRVQRRINRLPRACELCRRYEPDHEATCPVRLAQQLERINPSLAADIAADRTEHDHA
ncbi:hypothetical protein [Nakamurella lactea]|uniref:hypothetical protein n=1 Tax=Nakamurella lactea TaxID=459515 RepID=UPI00048F0080|nr:hypothetical protein [Nakamurella lactea]